VAEHGSWESFPPRLTAAGMAAFQAQMSESRAAWDSLSDPLPEPPEEDIMFKISLAVDGLSPMSRFELGRHLGETVARCGSTIRTGAAVRVVAALEDLAGSAETGKPVTIALGKAECHMLRGILAVALSRSKELRDTQVEGAMAALLAGFDRLSGWEPPPEPKVSDRGWSDIVRAGG
jgi:hypothetical protein